MAFFSSKCCFGLKMTAERFLLDIHLKKYTMQNYLLPTLMNSDSPMFWGCIGPNGTIHLIECKRTFHKIEYIDILQENAFESSAKMFLKEFQIQFQFDKGRVYCLPVYRIAEFPLYVMKKLFQPIQICMKEVTTMMKKY